MKLFTLSTTEVIHSLDELVMKILSPSESFFI
jgi:hypothetical protein